MSLLKKASIITTPTAYAEDYLYSIKPAIPFGDELIVNGNFYTDSNWSKGTGWSISGGKAVKVAGTADALRQNTIPTGVIGKKYKISFDAVVTAGVGNSTLYGVSTTPNFSTTGSYEYIITATSTIGFNIFVTSTFVGTIDNVSVKEVTDADFDFDRNSTGTRVNEDYLIEDVPYNLASYSENLSQWVNVRTTDSLSTISSPQNTTNVYKIIPTTDNATHRLDQIITLDDNNTYTLSFFAKKEEYNCIRAAIGKTSVSGNTVSFNLNTGVKTETGTVAGSTMNLLPNGWYRCSLTTTAGTADRVVIGIGNNDTYSFAGDASSGLYLWGIQLVKGDQPKDYLKTTDRLDIPRIDYTNGEPSMLLEPQSTNLCTHSVDFATGVSSGSLNLGNNSTLTYVSNVQAPDGTMGVYRLQNPAQGSTYLSFYNGNSKNVSVYVKAVDVNKDNQFTLFKSSGSPNVSDVFSATSNWQRYNFEYAQTGNITGINNEGDTYASDVYIWGAQVEDTNSYATSLIHTSGSTVTRSADVANNAGNSDLISSTEGVLYAEIAALADDGTNRAISINNGGLTDYLFFRYRSSNEFQIIFRVNNSNVVNEIHTLSNNLDFNKIAFSYKLNEFKLFINGLQIVNTITSGAVFGTTINSLDFDEFNGTNKFYGKAKMIAVFKEALTDLELQKLTGYNNHELYMNYYNRLSYLGLAEEYNVESDINNYIL